MMWRKIHCTLLCLRSSHAHYDAWSPEFEHESTTDRQGACDRGVIIHTAHLDDFVRQHWNKSTYIVHHFVCPYDCFFHRIFLVPIKLTQQSAFRERSQHRPRHSRNTVIGQSQFDSEYTFVQLSHPAPVRIVCLLGPLPKLRPYDQKCMEGKGTRSTAFFGNKF